MGGAAQIDDLRRRRVVHTRCDMKLTRRVGDDDDGPVTRVTQRGVSGELAADAEALMSANQFPSGLQRAGRMGCLIAARGKQAKRGVAEEAEGSGECRHGTGMETGLLDAG